LPADITVDAASSPEFAQIVIRTPPRDWVKVKNRDYRGYELERESAMRQRVSRRPMPSPR
jgi:hypothetical protein